MKAIINTKLILEDSIVFDGVLLYESGYIVAAGKRQEILIPADAEILDAQGLYTSPGFVDIHNHGSQTALFTEDPMGCAEHFLRHGQTTVLPTLYCTLSLKQMLQGARKIRQASQEGAGRIIAGLYMEGPYMNGEGSDQKHILWDGAPDPREYIPLIQGVKDMAKVWSVCPARPGIENFLQALKAESPEAIISLGHSHATAADCRKIKKYGLKLQTHHGDSGKAPGPNQVTIGAGCDEFTLYDPDMYAELICDQEGIHLPGDLIKMVVRTKGIERIILITDSMPSSGNYTNNEADGVLYGPDLNYDCEGHLAGSHLTLDNACRNLMAHTGYGLCHAIRCASLNPAKLLGLENKIGSIAPGKLANLILIDDTVCVQKVIFRGETVWDI